MLKQTFGEGVDDRAATLSNPWPRGPKHIYHVMGRRAGSRTRPRAGTTPRESARSPRRSAARAPRRPGPPAAGVPPGRARERAGLGSCVGCGAISCALRMIFVSYPGIVDTIPAGASATAPTRTSLFTLHPRHVVPAVRACQAQGRGIDTTRVLRSARWTSEYFIVYFCQVS